MQQPSTQQYGDLLEPKPVPFSLMAPGWYVVGALLLIGLLFFIYSYIKYYMRNRYRRKALLWLEKMDQEHAAEQLYAADMLMKRIAMQVYGRQEVATLQGMQWIRFLNNSSSRQPDIFSEDDSRLLFDVFYRNPQEASVTATATFISKTRNWIRHHHALRNRI